MRQEEEALQLLEEKPPLRIDPEGTFKMRWDMFMLLLVYYVSLVTPMNLAFFADGATSDDTLLPYQVILETKNLGA